MTAEALRSIERLHGVLAWLSTAALAVSAYALSRGRDARRIAALAAAAALGLVVAAGGLGVALHDPYRSRLRQKLFLRSASLGWLFERKQHLAFGAVLLACAAAAAVAAAHRVDDRRGDAALVRDLRRGALLASIASAVLALAASVASVIVARRVAF